MNTTSVVPRSKLRRLLLMAVAACAITVASQIARAELTVLSPTNRNFGKTYSDLAGEWWQWALRTPMDRNPVSDKTGQFATNGQSGNIFFLAGTFGEQPGPTRHVEIQQGKPLFFPLLNLVVVHTDPTDPDTLPGLLALLEPMRVAGLSCVLDGVPVTGFTNYYVRSGAFEVTVPDNNLFGAPAGTYGPSAAVGYWIMVAPPSVGTHTITFTGAVINNVDNPDDDFFLDVTYEIVVKPRSADLSKLVVVGDSLMAGYRDGGLVDVYQRSSIPALIAKQARVPFPQPLIGWPGIKPVLQIVSAGPPPVILPAPGSSTGRVDMTLVSQNLAVPGHTVADALYTRPNLPVDSMADLVLGLPGLIQGVSKSQVEWAEMLKPSTVLVWIGNNDALNAALIGDPRGLTPLSQFRTNYAALLDRLAATGATLAVANIPDVGVIPFVQPVANLAGMLGVPTAVFQQALGVSADDKIILDGLSDVVDILQGKKAGPLAANYVLTPAEIQAIRAATADFNAIIAEQAKQKGALFVDLNAFLNRLLVQGADIGLRHINTSFLGGIFSLDGIHVTSEGAALVANQFIQQLNRSVVSIPAYASLNIVKESNGLLLKWPIEADGCAVESCTNLTAGSWQILGSGTVSTNGYRELRVPKNQSASFFRLHFTPGLAGSAAVSLSEVAPIPQSSAHLTGVIPVIRGRKISEGLVNTSKY